MLHEFLSTIISSRTYLFINFLRIFCSFTSFIFIDAWNKYSVEGHLVHAWFNFVLTLVGKSFYFTEQYLFINRNFRNASVLLKKTILFLFLLFPLCAMKITANVRRLFVRRSGRSSPRVLHFNERFARYVDKKHRSFKKRGASHLSPTFHFF